MQVAYEVLCLLLTLGRFVCDVCCLAVAVNCVALHQSQTDLFLLAGVGLAQGLERVGLLRGGRFEASLVSCSDRVSVTTVVFRSRGSNFLC